MIESILSIKKRQSDPPASPERERWWAGAIQQINNHKSTIDNLKWAGAIQQINNQQSTIINQSGLMIGRKKKYG